MEYLSQTNSFDVIIIISLLIFTARGIWTGFIRQIASIVAMVLGFVIAGQLHGDFYEIILPFISTPQIAFVVSYTVLFGVIYLTVLLIGLGLKKVVDIVFLAWFDRTLGGLLGATKAVFLTILIFMALNSMLSSSNNFLKKSLSYPYLAASSEYILQLIKDKNLRELFDLKEPAIKELPVPEKKEREKGSDKATEKKKTTATGT